jgi:hypothetical protein
MKTFQQIVIIFFSIFNFYPNIFAKEIKSSPEIEITIFPKYGTTEDVGGIVRFVNPSEYRVAVLIYVGERWWTKPTFEQPFVNINQNGTWVCDITTGGDDIHSTRIAAFLIPSSFTPPQCAGRNTIPNAIYENCLDFDVYYRGTYDRIVDFMGYQWRIKKSDSVVGPGPNFFSDSISNIWLDSNGFHFTIKKEVNDWKCTEAILERNLGYGIYTFHISGRFDILDPQAVAGFFTWDSNAPPNYREIDFEFSKWGNPNNENNSQYVVQPFSIPQNIYRYKIEQSDNDLNLTLVLEWRENFINFKTIKGHIQPSNIQSSDVINSWTYLGENIPTPGDENIRVNFWLYEGQPPQNLQNLEFSLKAFYFSKEELSNKNSNWCIYY